jgi:hypothetical protein
MWKLQMIEMWSDLLVPLRWSDSDDQKVKTEKNTSSLSQRVAAYFCKAALVHSDVAEKILCLYESVAGFALHFI